MSKRLPILLDRKAKRRGTGRDAVTKSKESVTADARPKHAARVCPLLKDEAEGDVWVKCCLRRFYPLAMRIAGSDDLAMDALQESWIKILRAVRAHAYRGYPPACAWVSTIIANTAKDTARKHSRWRDQGLPLAEGDDLQTDPALSPENLAGDAQLLQMFREMIMQLPKMYREVLELRYGREFSTTETAEILDISRTNVTTRLDRATSMLRKQIDTRLDQGHSRRFQSPRQAGRDRS